MTGMVAQICPNAYSGSRAMRQKASRWRSRSTGAVAAERGGDRDRLHAAGRVSRCSTIDHDSRNTPQTIAEAKKWSRNDGSTASSDAARSAGRS